MRKYMHVERYGNEEVDGINIGEVYVFPKIDGTNGSLFFNGDIQACSRNRVLSKEKDNQGFLNIYVKTHQDKLKEFFNEYPNYIIYGEYLIPHTLKTYKNSAWKKFYIFDIYDIISEKYLHYKKYKPICDKFNLDYIPPLRIINNGKYENFAKLLDKNYYLIEDGKGQGEGIVLKNYNYKNKYGRTVWAKIVRSEFREKHYKNMGAPKVEYKNTESKIIEKYLTNALIEKEYSKIVNLNNGWKSKYIPQLFGRIYHCFINEELWNILKKEKDPKINFKTLKQLLIAKVKRTKSELF